jgi:formamidopyrimidine-DNA glycosylase
MPELPEVETIVRALREGGRGGAPLVSRKVQSVRLLWARSLAVPDESSFLERLPGQDIIDISRRGKYIVMQLSQDFMLVHLRMSGDLRVDKLVDNPDQLLEPHDRAAFWLNGDVRLVFNDPRKFGRIWLVSDPQTVVGRLGPEPLEETFVLPLFFSGLQKRRRQLKPLLLDQGFIAGIGNIYSDEALHLAGLHPCRLASSLSETEAESLYHALRQVLNEGIRTQGASIDWIYRGGRFQNNFNVYQRTGESCKTCGTPIIRLVVGQRGTHICPRCQPES